MTEENTVKRAGKITFKGRIFGQKKYAAFEGDFTGAFHSILFSHYSLSELLIAIPLESSITCA